MCIFVKAWCWICHLKTSRGTLANILTQPNSKKIITTFIRNVWFSVSNITQSFRLRIVFKLLKFENCLWRFYTKFGFSFPLSRKIFRLQFSLIFLRKNRSEAFCVSSENILHLTFRGLFSGGKFSTKPIQIYTNY